MTKVIIEKIVTVERKWTNGLRSYVSLLKKNSMSLYPREFVFVLKNQVLSKSIPMETSTEY